MESLFLLAFGEEQSLAAAAMTGSEVFFNKLLEDRLCGLRLINGVVSTGRCNTRSQPSLIESTMAAGAGLYAVAGYSTGLVLFCAGRPRLVRGTLRPEAAHDDFPHHGGEHRGHRRS